MYSIGQKPRPYADPWVLDVDIRLDQLRRPGATHIAYYYDYPDSSTFRYRCYNMAQAVNRLLPEASAACFWAADAEVLDRVVDAADVLVLCRARYSDQLNRMVTRAQRLGRRVIYDIDDFIFSGDYVHLLMNTLDQAISEEAWNHWFAYVGRIGAALRLCGRATTTNSYLADRIREQGVGDVRIIPNFLNLEQVEASQRVMAAKRARNFRRDARVHVGYFSGTPTHTRDFELVATTLADQLARRPKMVLRLVGYLDLPPVLQPLATQVERLPLQDFVNLQQCIGETEINIVPLQDNIFTNCKSELKFIEAAIVGGITLASPTHILRSAIEDGETGYLVAPQSWGDILDKVIGSLPDQAGLIERAATAVAAVYGWEAQAAVIAQAVLER
jgi:glycosyltransferase involved in cell wall biosynthesis